MITLSEVFNISLLTVWCVYWAVINVNGIFNGVLL